MQSKHCIGALVSEAKLAVLERSTRLKSNLLLEATHIVLAVVQEAIGAIVFVVLPGWAPSTRSVRCRVDSVVSVELSRLAN